MATPKGCRTVVIEAAAVSLPVVASDHSGASEAAADGRGGLIVAEGNTGAPARRIPDPLASPRLRGAMAAFAGALAEERFDAIRQTRMPEAIYGRLRQAAAVRPPGSPF